LSASADKLDACQSDHPADDHLKRHRLIQEEIGQEDAEDRREIMERADRGRR